MKKNNYYKFVSIGFFSVMFMVPFNISWAATVYLESSRNVISIGDTVMIAVKVDAGGVTTNTIDGNIVVKNGGGTIEAKEFTLANSVFGLWPRTPSLSKDGQTISFVGGVPGGFNIEGATLFQIVFEAKKEGTVTISPQNIVAFANDGEGTKLPTKTRDLIIKVNSKQPGVVPTDEWGALIAQDITPPEDFIVVLGQDQSMYNGKRFAYFSALDKQSGVAYYEVSENEAKAIRTGSVYVLQNQSNDNVKLSVTAYDKAGNKKVSSYPGKKNFFDINWISVIAVLLVIFGLKIVYKKFEKKIKNVFKRN